MLDVLANIQKAKHLAQSDGRDHDATMIFSRSNLGLTLSVSIKRNAKSVNNLERYCALKMYQNKLEKWIVLLIDFMDGRESIDFRVYNQKWNHSAAMEGQLERYRERKLKEFIATGKRLGRNDPCPCNSGIKYKKCCGK